MLNIVGIIGSYIFVGTVMALGKIFERFGEEASRKFIHIMLANWWIIAMLCFNNVICAAIAPFSFVIINYISYKKGIIKVMEREKKDGLGTVYYALSLLILSIICFGIIRNPSIGLISVFVMGYSDGLAAVIGKNIKSKEYKIGNSTKTLFGSLTMFIVTMLIISIYLAIVGASYWILKTIIASLILTILEAISIKGTDNITVPLATCLLLCILI